jgi:cell division protein FtsI (penicillin-binding protein 3)
MDLLENLKKIPFIRLDQSLRWRSLILANFCLLLLALLCIQFYRLQIIQGAKWSSFAYNQHYQSVVEPFKRGSFWSNTSVKGNHLTIPQALVRDIPKFHLYADAMMIPAEFRHEIVENIVSIISDESLEASEYLCNSKEKKKLEDQGEFSPERPFVDSQTLLKELGRESRSRRLISWLDSEKRDCLNRWWYPYAKRHKIPHNALFFLSDYQRSYPFGKLLGQVLHTIQEKKDQSTHQGVPTGGLEMMLNRYLSGSQGRRVIPRSLRHRLGAGEILSPAHDGADVYLTINHYLQAIAEEELEKGIVKAKAKAGWAVIMNPHSGEILALAQYPFFYPQKYQEFFNDPEKIKYTRVLAVMDSFEPGSTMKAITIAAALTANIELKKRGKPPLFSPEEVIPTSNGFFPGRKRPIVDTHLHRYLNMDLAIQKSSNIYMAKLADRIIAQLGAQWYREFLARAFGLGEKTGIELPAESAGLLPTPGKVHPNGLLEWSLATPYSLAMGYNLRTTSLQMLRAYAVIANGGYLVQPTLIRRIIKRDGEKHESILMDHTTQQWRKDHTKRGIEPQVASRVLTALKYVTKRGGGAFRADIEGYSEAGKTSTTHKAVDGGYSDSRYFSTFVGIVPANTPQFVLLIGVDEPEKFFIPGVGYNQRGATCAAPIFRAIASRMLEYLGIAPDDPYGYPYGDPRRNPQLSDYSQEVKDLEQLYKQLNSLQG